MDCLSNELEELRYLGVIEGNKIKLQEELQMGFNKAPEKHTRKDSNL